MIWTFIDRHYFDINDTDIHGRTVLHFSARNDNQKLFQYFFNMGIDIDLQDKDGINCCHIATIYGHFNLFIELINVNLMYMQLIVMDRPHFIFLQETIIMIYLLFLLLWEMVLNSKQGMERTIIILPPFMDIWVFAKNLRIYIRLI